MKIRILPLLLILGIGIFTSCNNDDDNVGGDDDPIQLETPNGSWNLRSISGGFAGGTNNYENGIIIWTFNDQNLTLDVENNSPQQNHWSGYESGTYTYSVIENDGNEYIQINNGDSVKYELSIDNLVIKYGELLNGGIIGDGYTVRLEK